MSAFWRSWMGIWCLGVGLFGAVIALAGMPGGEAPMRMALELLGGAPVEVAGALRFTLAVLGAVTIGWAATLWALVRAAGALGAEGGPLWRLLLWSVLGWYVIDSLLSVVTRFGLNVVPNTLFLLLFLLPLWRSGVLATGAARVA